MKICWDNLEGISLSVNGNLSKNNSVYIEDGPCKVCGEFFIREKNNSRKSHGYCSRECSNRCRNMSISARKKISAANLGRTVSTDVRERISKSSKGRAVSDLTRHKLSKSQLGENNHRYGRRSHNYNGVKDFGRTLYTTYYDKLCLYEECRRSSVEIDLLEVRCSYCGKWFSPNVLNVKNRLLALSKNTKGECRLYCSDNCKKACPTYGQRKYSKGYKPASSREVQPQLRQLVFERDNYTCQKCGKTVEDVALHCHHILPLNESPIESADVSNCITLCKSCHKQVHKLPDCTYHVLKCNN